VNIVLRKE